MRLGHGLLLGVLGVLVRGSSAFGDDASSALADDAATTAATNSQHHDSTGFIIATTATIATTAARHRPRWLHDRYGNWRRRVPFFTAAVALLPSAFEPVPCFSSTSLCVVEGSKPTASATPISASVTNKHTAVELAASGAVRPLVRHQHEVVEREVRLGHGLLLGVLGVLARRSSAFADAACATFTSHTTAAARGPAALNLLLKRPHLASTVL